MNKPIYILAEKHHRYCFDKLYKQDVKRTFWRYLCLRLLDVIQRTIPVYRSELAKSQQRKYKRYTIQP